MKKGISKSFYFTRRKAGRFVQKLAAFIFYEIAKVTVLPVRPDSVQMKADSGHQFLPPFLLKMPNAENNIIKPHVLVYVRSYVQCSRTGVVFF